MERIKSCPFCGESAELTSSVTISNYTGYDVKVDWKIQCIKCGTRKESSAGTYYKLDNDGRFVIIPRRASEIFDGRKEVIEQWNTRVEHIAFNPY